MNLFKRKLKRVPLVYALALPLTILFSCKKLPETDFTYTPLENPEAGEIIRFENTTPEASSYEWDFGDENSSREEHPSHIYAEAGNFVVKLTASNEDGDQDKFAHLSINEPTILAFLVVDSTRTLPLEEAEVWIFDNETDWNNFANPILIGYTDAEGKVEFSNMESMLYFIYAVKNETDGFWITGGYTPTLVLNEINSFLLPCEWYRFDEKKAIRRDSPATEYLRSAD